MGLFNLFGGDSNPTTNTTDASTKTQNTTTNTSFNSTVSDTNTVTQDRRLVTDHGLGVNADNSTLSLSNSGNNTTNTTTSDYGAVKGALDSNTLTSLAGLDMSLQMMKANLAFSQHLTDSNSKQSNDAVKLIVDTSKNALDQVTAIAAKPLNANDPQHILVIVGLVVFGVFVFKGFK